ALFGIKWAGSQEQVFALEVDRNTKSPRKFLAKILGYDSFLGSHGGLYGFNDFVVLVVGEDPLWLEKDRAAVSRHGSCRQIWFAKSAEAQTKGANQAIGTMADGAEKYSLRDLTFLPYSKEGSDFES